MAPKSRRVHITEKGERYEDGPSILEALGYPVSLSHLRYMARNGKIPALRVGSRWLYNRDEIRQALISYSDETEVNTGNGETNILGGLL